MIIERVISELNQDLKAWSTVKVDVIESPNKTEHSGIKVNLQ